MATKLIDLDKLQREDHDTIVRLEAKIDGLVIDVKGINDGTSSKIADHESRIRKLEDSLIIYEPTKNIQRLEVVEAKVQRMTETAMIWRSIAGVLGGAIFFILTQLPNWLRIIGIVK